MPAKAHRPFVGGNKNDVHDARAIWRAVQRPDVKALAVKTEEQQGRRGLQRMRGQWVKLRTARINGLRGLLTENGELMLQGKAGIRGGIGEAVQRLSDRVLAMVIDPLGEQWARIGPLDDQIGEIERRVKGWHKEDQACQRIADIPGVGLPSARAALATMGDAKAFRSGREFAACSGMGTAAKRHRRTYGALGNAQTRRHLSAHAADSRRALGAEN
jgi:transposase